MMKKIIYAVALIWGCMASASAVTTGMVACFDNADTGKMAERPRKDKETEAADEIVLNMGEQFGSVNIDEIDEWQQEGFSFRASAGENAKGKVPCYKSKNKEVRLYALNTLRMEAPEGRVITAVSFVLSAQGVEEQAEITVSAGEIQGQTVGGSAIDWTGNASAVTFTVGETNAYHPDGIVDGSGQLDFTQIRIKTEAAMETGISSVLDSADSEAPIAYYTLSGARVLKPSSGVYICKQGHRSYKVCFR